MARTPSVGALRPEHDDAGHEDGRLQQDGNQKRTRRAPGRQRIDPAAHDQEIVADAREHHPGLVRGEARPAGGDALAGPQDVVQPHRAVVAFPQQLHDSRHDQDRDDQRADQRQPPRRPPLRQRQRQDQRRQGREHQPPFDQPAQGEKRADQGHAAMARPIEPQARQEHRAQHQGVARHDVLADHRQQEEETASEMEAGGQQGRPGATGHAMNEGIDEDDREARPQGVEIGELLPRNATQDAQRVESAGKRTVEREIEVVRRIEPRVRGIGNPGLGLDALVHPVGGDDVNVLQPVDQAAEHQQ